MFRMQRCKPEVVMKSSRSKQSVKKAYPSCMGHYGGGVHGRHEPFPCRAWCSRGVMRRCLPEPQCSARQDGHHRSGQADSGLGCSHTRSGNSQALRGAGSRPPVSPHALGKRARPLTMKGSSRSVPTRAQVAVGMRADLDEGRRATVRRAPKRSPGGAGGALAMPCVCPCLTRQDGPGKAIRFWCNLGRGGRFQRLLAPVWQERRASYALVLW
jgi:hypothetical protein